MNTQRDQLQSAISDTFKEIHGHRPHYQFNYMSVAELRTELKYLYACIDAEVEAERHSQEVKAEEAKVSHLYHSEPLDWEDEDLKFCF